MQSLSFFPREHQHSSLLPVVLDVSQLSDLCPDLSVVRYVGVDVDGDTVRGHQLSVHSRGLALHLTRVLHHVNLDGQLQPGDEVPDGGQGDVTGVAEELPGLVADVTGLSLLIQSPDAGVGVQSLTSSLSNTDVSSIFITENGLSFSRTSLALVHWGWR